jgi:hypothetical protein
MLNNPDYRKTYVYGNILIEEDGGNSQVMHYGGDGGNTAFYRKGKLYFYNNTLYSIRAGNTTLARLSTNDETADIRNNILHVTASGNRLAFLDQNGVIDLSHNLLKTGWLNSHQGGSFSGTVNDDGSSVETSDPGFNNGGAYDFTLDPMSPAINSGTTLHADAGGSYNVTMEYVIHQAGQIRPSSGGMDIGGYEYSGTVPVELSSPFKVALSGNSIRMTWSTAIEHQVDHFHIKRMDDPLRNYWTVVPKGGSSHYSIVDHNQPNESVEYQLWEVDKEGRKELIGSDQLLIQNQTISLKSNLIRDRLNLSFPHSLQGRQWQIFNIAGEIVRSGMIHRNELSGTDLKPGKYFILVQGHPPLSFIKL